MTYSTEQISHKLDGYAASQRSLDDVRLMQAVSLVVTHDGKFRADRIDGWIPPESVPIDAIERGTIVDIDFSSIAAGAVGTVAVAIPGAQENDAVTLGAPSDLESGLLAFGHVSANGIVTIRLFNGTAGAINPASNTWRIILTR